MLRNYLLIALREVFKNKIFSLIHILGLALGIAAFVQILQYSFYELSYDRFYENAGQIYRIRQDRYENGKLSTTWGAGCPAIGPALKSQFPEVVDFARLTDYSGIVSVGERNFRENRMFIANSSFLTMFPLKMISGIPASALDEPFTAVISESIAKKYFGHSNPMGRTISLNNKDKINITGVFKDIPENTHLKFNILISWPTYVKWRGPQIETTWFQDGYYTYLLLQKGTSIPAFENKMQEFTNKQWEEIDPQRTISAEYILQPLRSIHLHSHLMWEAEVNGDADMVYFLMAIAIIILIIAWVNYINLSTVKAVYRSREVAMRKISGALKKHLIAQFLTESFVVNSAAAVLAFLIVLITLPWLRNLTGRDLTLYNSELWLIFIVLLVAGPLLSGIYPAMVISSFKPMTLFRGKKNGITGGAFLRKALVIFQFAASIFLIAGTLTVYKQLIYMKSQDLGVEIDQTIVLEGPGVSDSTFNDKLSSFKEELLKYPVVTHITASTSVPGSKVEWNAGGIRLAGADESTANQYRVIGIDQDYIDTYGLSVLKGRNFSKEFTSDESSVLFNEEAVKIMGFDNPESAIGEVIDFWGKNYTIIGVLKNFHLESLKENYDALIFRMMPGVRNYFSIRLNLGGQPGTDSYRQTQSTLKTIRDNWERFFPGNPFEYFFLSEHYDKQYHAEKQFRTIFGVFAILAIFIACMGLFGLSWFIIVRRTKEIGIRKVIGASIGDMLLLVSRDFLKLVFTGALIAALPVKYFAMKWLEKYPFRIDFSWWLFLLAGFLICLVALLTISYHTMAIARSNPARSIRYE